MKTLKLRETDYDLENGFAWCIYEDENKDILSLQVCLEERKNKKTFMYKKSINKNDSGIDEGLCGDNNKAMFDKYGKDECIKRFFKDIKNSKITLKSI